MTRLVAAAALALLLAGCSSDSDPKPDDAAQEPSASALPTVSAATTCGQLFDGGAAPVPDVIDLMKQPETMPSDAEDARGLADDLEPIGAQANDELAPHVAVVVDELREFADTVDDLGSYDTGDLVTSLTELNNVCGGTPRF
ncbi:hypothetical protein [Nocardioides sp.]|uniref:hypothetical protein n=1 Tax=Nocardioides sp. TaxID=35761 RepID=UPI0035B42CC6